VLGSGFVIDKQGHIVTNNHVISGATSIHVSFANNDNVKATVVGRDAATDLAVLKVDLPARALNPLVFGDSGSLEPGDPVVAIGNPFGFDRSITSGIVSALNRPLESGTNSQITNNMIQTDAAINHGNSGGPLLNSLGQVIGVNSSIETGGTTDGNVGVGFAIPSDTVKNIVQQLIKSGKATHPYIGVSVRQITPTLARLFRLPVNHGLMIQSVTPGSGAAKAGLKGGTTSVVVSGNPYSLGGDIITAVDGKSVGSSFTKLEADIASHKPGDAISLTIYRMSTSSTASTQMTVSVTVGNRS
jgi:S1-C subfamily serine protease